MKLTNFLSIFFFLLLHISSCSLPEPNANAHARDGLSDDYEDFGRVIWQKPDKVISLFSDLTGKTVADIGAGTGFFSRRLTNSAKKVIAIDIDERFITYLDSIRTDVMPKEFGEKLEPRLSKIDDPLLQAGDVDAVLIVNTFMYMLSLIHISEPTRPY